MLVGVMFPGARAAAIEPSNERWDGGTQSRGPLR